MFSLDSLFPPQVPYPIKGGIIRAIRTGIALIAAGITASIADGSIIQSFHFIPPEYKVFVLGALSTAFVGVDKWLREKGLVDEAAEANANIPLTGSVTPDKPVGSVVDVPDPVTNVNDDDVVDTTSDNIDNSVDPADDVNPTVFDDPKDDIIP